MHVYDKNIDIFHLLSEAVSEGIIVVNKDQLIVSINQKNDSLGSPFSYLSLHNYNFPPVDSLS